MSLAGELRLIPIPFADEIAPGDALAESTPVAANRLTDSVFGVEDRSKPEG